MLQMLRRRMYREEKGFTLIELLEADGAAHPLRLPHTDDRRPAALRSTMVSGAEGGRDPMRGATPMDDLIERLRDAIAREGYVVDTRLVAEALLRRRTDLAVLAASSAVERRAASPPAHQAHQAHQASVRPRNRQSCLGPQA